MEAVLGIGGLFVRAKDPAALAAWYDEHLGVRPPPDSAEGEPWWQQAGPTAFAPMGDDAGPFQGSEHSWSINFSVADLDAMVEQLRSAGIEVEVNPETYAFGRFASLKDPEDNPLELWEPAEP